jgi:predicted outer membrane repeat protein
LNGGGNTWQILCDCKCTQVANLSVTQCRGVLSLNSSLTLIGANFSDHFCASSGSGCGVTVVGGGTTTVEVSECSFQGLAAPLGSALAVSGTASLIVRNSVFKRNGYYETAATPAAAGQMNEEGAEVVVVATQGGAVWVSGTASRSSESSGSGVDYGSGFGAAAGSRGRGGGVKSFENCLFEGNVAQVSGGAVAVQGASSSSAVTSTSASSLYSRAAAAAIAIAEASVVAVKSSSFYSTSTSSSTAASPTTSTTATDTTLSIETTAETTTTTTTIVMEEEVLFLGCSFLLNSIFPSDDCAASVECDAIGGAVYVEASASGVAFQDCSFQNNLVSSSSSSSSSGLFG